MPVHRTKTGGYQWGSHGKLYKGKGAKAKAAAQGAAAHAHQSRRPGERSTR